MQYRILGKTGLKISRMGFGGIPIQRTTAEETKKLLSYLGTFISSVNGSFAFRPGQTLQGNLALL